VALDEHGKPSFNLLPGFGYAQAIVLYVFDLVGYNEGPKLMYAAGFERASRRNTGVFCWLISTRSEYNAVRSQICPIALMDAGARASRS
jgi:hypothetical protein